MQDRSSTGRDEPRALTRAAVREADRRAIEELLIPGVVLMENAGRDAARAVLDLLGERRPSNAATASPAAVVIACGGGNNGGDGFVIARHLHNAGICVRIALACNPEKLTGDAAINFRIVERMKLPIAPIATAADVERVSAEWAGAAVIVDALLGTGAAGEPREPIASLIRRINTLSESGAAVVAIDLPSGLDCDTGTAASACIRADLTVTFVASKVGFNARGADRYTGRVIVADIGAPKR